MDLNQLRYVVAVAEELNFTRAAERCFVVQSALSHQVKALEREVGAPLFARSTRRVELTPAGHAFVAQARQALAASERALADAAAADGRVRGTLSLSTIPTVSAVDLPATLAAFHREHPEVDVTVRTGSSDQMVRDLAAGRIELAFLGLPEVRPPVGVAHRELARETLVAVLPHDHPAGVRSHLSLHDLAELTFVDFPTGSPGREQSDRAFDAARLQRRVAFETTSPAFMLDLVRHGLGVCLLSAGVVPPDPSLRAVPVTDGPVRVEYLAWNDFNPSPAAVAFLALVG